MFSLSLMALISAYTLSTRDTNMTFVVNFAFTTVVDAVLAGWQFSQLDAIQLAAYSICVAGFFLNALPSNWSENAIFALGGRSRDSSNIVTSLYQRARRATRAHLP